MDGDKSPLFARRPAVKTDWLTLAHRFFVLQTFRRRLTLPEAIYFAGVLPPVLRSIFVADWDTNEPRGSFGERAEMTQEVQSLRAEHNFAPNTAIRAVAVALRKNIDEARLDNVLNNLPTAARDFWCP